MLPGQLISALTGLIPLAFMTTQLLQLSLGQFDVLQDLGSEVVFWFVARDQELSPCLMLTLSEIP